MIRLKLSESAQAAQVKLSQSKIAALVKQQQAKTAERLAAKKKQEQVPVTPAPPPAPTLEQPPAQTPPAVQVQPVPPKKQAKPPTDRPHFKNVQLRLGFLRKTYPLAFFKQNRKPLKINIDADLFQNHPEMSKKLFCDALRFYCNHGAYLTSMVEGATRLDLSGNECGKVTAKEAAHASSILETRRLKSAANAVDAGQTVQVEEEVVNITTSKSERLRMFEERLKEATGKITI